MMSMAAMAVAGGFTGCSNNETDLFDENLASKQKEAMYQAAFENEFGKVSSSVNWGFTNQTNATRGANVNRNEWGTGNGVGGHVAIPANVTPEERELVYNYFNVARVGAVNQNNVNWTDYFVSQVWKGEDVYKDGFGNDVKGSDGMNHLQCLKGEGSIDANGNLVGDWEHINDFNDADQWSGYGSIVGHTYMENSGTLDFAYHNTSDSKYHNEYIIIPGAEIDESLAGYWYVGFDFYATHPEGQEANRNMDVDRDWIFTDWIVRISPAEFTGAQRVFVEDLIATELTDVKSSDWDFNDAVFDVFINYNEYWHDGDCAIITVRAAGGELPLTIAGREIHQVLGVATKDIVNTGRKTVAPAQFRLSKDEITSTNANDIIVKVGDIELKAVQGAATQKLCGPTSVEWLNERVNIATAKSNFKPYVAGQAATWY